MTISTPPTPSKYVVGIDLGAVTSGVSIAHVDDRFNIFAVKQWEETKKPSSKKLQQFFSSILYTNDENSSIVCGGDRADSDFKGIYIPNIGQYLFDIDNANEKLGQMMDGLTIQKVIADYLEFFITLALKRLEVHEKFSQSEYFKDFDIQNVDNVRYCFVCPKVQQPLVKECFIKAGVIEEHELEDRLSFITEAEATAYHQLSLNRKSTKINTGESYLVCDIGEASVGIAKIYADSTESFSTVELVSENSRQGSINLENKFRTYLEKNITILNLNNSIINDLIKVFVDNIKFGFNMIDPQDVAFSLLDADNNSINISDDDLNKEVFLPFIEDIIKFISSADKASDSRIFLSGKYGVDSYFIEHLTTVGDGKFERHLTLIGEPHGAISSGAVSSILHTQSVQIPYLKDLNEAVIETPSEDPVVKNNGNDGYDFIVGIDFGTTFSGCSYVKLKDGKNTIKTIKEKWPGGNSLVFGKTPTLLMYDKKMKPLYWGDEARLKVNHNKNLPLLGKFKLFLCPQSLKLFYGAGNEDLEDIRSSSGYEELQGKKKNAKSQLFAINVIASYLKVFKNHVVEYIIANETNDKFTMFNSNKLLAKYKFRYVITVPAMWNASARDTMAQAAIDATIIKKADLDQLLIISEPEAAALYCEKRFNEYFDTLEGNLNGTNFIVCDAGGGTVDLVTFELTVKQRKDGNGNSIKESMICQIGDGVGDTCGSTFLDLAFKNYLIQFYKEIGVNVDSTNINFEDVMHDFVKKHKPYFMPNSTYDSYYDIDLPGQSSVINFTGSKKYILINDNTTLRMRNIDMQTEVFDPIVKRILELINVQRKQAKSEGREINAILMVGGFSQSKYLQQRIEDEYRGICTVSVPYEGVTAISHGAVSYALNPRMISRRRAGQSLGLEVQAPFEKTDMADFISKKVKGPDDIDYAKNRLRYFVKKDQELDGERRSIYITKVQVKYPNDAVIANYFYIRCLAAIFSCDSKEDANNRYVTNSHAKIMEKKITIPLVAGIEEGDMIDFTVSLRMEHIGVTVTIDCQNALINAKIRDITNNKKGLTIETKCDLNVAKCKKSLIQYSLAKSGYLFNIKESA